MKGTTLKRLAIKVLIFAKKAAPYVLATASAAGTVAITVEAVKEIKKNTEPVIYIKNGEDAPEKIPEGLTITEENAEELMVFKGSPFEIAKDKTIRAVKTYWKPIAICTGSVMCLACSTFIFSKRQQQLIIATHQMQALLQKYTEAATATAGIGGAATLNKLAPQVTPVDDIPLNVDDDGKTLFWDPYLDDGSGKGYYFRVSEVDFLSAAKDSMHCFVANGIESIENFYTRMGVAPPMDKNGDGYIGWGWVANEAFVSDWCEYAYDIYIDMSEKFVTDDGIEYRVVLYDKPPRWDMDILLDDCKKYLNRWY